MSLTLKRNYESHKILFITPFNKLAQQIRKQSDFNAITLNMLLGVFADGREYVKMNKYDVSEYDVICFDEVMLYGENELKRIHKFMKTNVDKKYFATGDVDQLKPFHIPNNVKNMKEYMMDCINQVFGNQITLKINKRLKSKADRKKLAGLKRDIFDTSKDIINVLSSYKFKTITDLDDLETRANITYFNFRSDVVNKYVHNQLVEKPKKMVKINGTEYYPGLELICRKRLDE